MNDDFLTARVFMNHTCHFLDCRPEVKHIMNSHARDTVEVRFPGDNETYRIYCPKFYEPGRQPGEMCRAACENRGVRGSLCSKPDYMSWCATANPAICR